MIQNCTILKVMDNSGAKEVMCFKVLKSKYNNQSANIGDIIKVSIKSLKDKSNTSLKKGDVFNAIILKQKNTHPRFNGQKIQFNTNSVILLKNDNTPVGSRIYGTITKEIRSENIKLLSLASNII